MRAFTRKGLAALVSTVAALASVGLAAPPASAEPGIVTCATGTTVITYDPPLTYTVQPTTATVHRELGACVSTRPDLTTGYVHEVYHLPLSCTGLLQGYTLTPTIHWNTGETSTLSVNAVATGVGNTAVNTFSGSITAGVFAGATIQWVETLPSLGLLLCLFGVPSQFGTLQTQITSTA